MLPTPRSLRSPRLALIDPAAATDEPRSWLRRTISLLWDNLASLALLNLAGSLIAAPLILLSTIFGFVPLLIVAALTLTPIIGGLMGAVSGEWRDEPGTIRQRFLATIRQRWLPLLALGGIAALGLGSSIITTSQLLTNPEVRWLTLWLAQSFFLVLGVVLLLYAMPLVAGHEMDPRLALRNALVLAIAAPLATLGMVAGLVLLTILMLWFGLGLWLIVPVVAAVFLTTNCEHQIERLRERSDPT